MPTADTDQTSTRNDTEIFEKTGETRESDLTIPTPRHNEENDRCQKLWE